MLYKIIEHNHIISSVETEIFTHDLESVCKVTGASEQDILQLKEGECFKVCGKVADFDISASNSKKVYMTVEDVLKDISCKYSVTPVVLYDWGGKEYEQFEFKDIADGNIPNGYLQKRVKYWKQHAKDGVVNITVG